MKSLGNIPSYIWCFVFFVVSGSIFITFVIFNKEIDQFVSTNIEVANDSTTKIKVKGEKAYLLKDNSIITLYFNHKFHKGVIYGMQQTKNVNEFEFNIKNLKQELLPGSILPAKIVYNQSTILESLLSVV